MGLYVNPRDMDKEEWLMDDSIEILPNLTNEALHTLYQRDEGSNQVLLCLVYNEGFNALAVMYEEKEIDRWTNPNDERPKTWFRVPKELLTDHVCPGYIFSQDEGREDYESNDCNP